MSALGAEFYSDADGFGTFGCAVVGCRDNGEGPNALYPGITACNYNPDATVDAPAGSPDACDWGASIANGYYTGYTCDGVWNCVTMGTTYYSGSDDPVTGEPIMIADYTAYIPFVLDMYGDPSTGWAGHSFQVVDWLDTQDGNASLIQGPFTFDASQPELTQVNAFNGLSYQTAMACLSSDLVTGCYIIQVGGGDDTVDPLWHLYGYQPVAGGPYVVDYSAGFSLEWIPTAGDAQGGGYIEGDSGGDQPGDDVVLGATL
jgi:hypothetical protein